MEFLVEKSRYFGFENIYSICYYKWKTMKDYILLSDIQNLCRELQTLGHFEIGSHQVANLVKNIVCREKDWTIVLGETEKKLTHMQRFKNAWSLIYPDTVLSHSQRLVNTHYSVIPLLKNYSQTLEVPLDLEYMAFFQMYHDFPEWIIDVIWDVATPVKYLLSSGARSTLDRIEVRSFDLIWADTLNAKKNHFKKLKQDTLKKQSIESKICSYQDKFDGFCSAFQDVLQGNENLIEPLINYIYIFQNLENSEIWKIATGIYITNESIAEEYQLKREIFNIPGTINLWWEIWKSSRGSLEESLREKFLWVSKNNDSSFVLPRFFQAWKGIYYSPCS